MPLAEQVALVSLTRDIPLGTLTQVAAAIQKQIVRDFEPVWGIPATVDAFEDLTSVPNDYHHVVIFNDPGELLDRLAFAIGEQNADTVIQSFRDRHVEGVHLSAFTRQPFALVAASDAWTVTTSHEALEMIIDPYGNRLIAAAAPGNPRKRVNYLIEVCDPCQAVWYHVNGVPMCDFITPYYFEPVRIDGFRYSFTGDVPGPLQLLEYGYLSWIDPIDSGLYQLVYGDAEPSLVASSLALRSRSGPLRTIVDTDPRTPRVTRWDSLRPAGTLAAPQTANLAMREAASGAAIFTAQAFASVLEEDGR
jgi:hypothetical protein